MHSHPVNFELREIVLSNGNILPEFSFKENVIGLMKYVHIGTMVRNGQIEEGTCSYTYIMWNYVYST